MNPLNDYPGARKSLYTLQWLVGGVLVVAGAYFTLSGTDIDALPRWYVVTAGLSPVVWTYLGVTAAQNVPSYRDVVEGDAPPPDERGESVLTLAIGAAVLVVLIIVIARLL